MGSLLTAAAMFFGIGTGWELDHGNLFMTLFAGLATWALIKLGKVNEASSR